MTYRNPCMYAPRDIKKHSCNHSSIIVFQNRELSKFPTIISIRKDKLWHVCIKILYSSEKKQLLHATAFTNLISNVGQEKPHTEKHLYCIILTECEDTGNIKPWRYNSG